MFRQYWEHKESSAGCCQEIPNNFEPRRRLSPPCKHGKRNLRSSRICKGRFPSQSTRSQLLSICQRLTTTKKVVKYFSHSTRNASKLSSMRSEMGIARGLEKVGKTRFATNYWSALSVERNMTLVCKLVEEGSAEIKVRDRIVLSF